MKPLAMFPNMFACISETGKPQLQTIDNTDAYWQAWDLASDSQHVANNIKYVYSRYFGKDIVFALPLNSLKQCQALTESYTGPHKDDIIGLCACILTGTPYTHGNGDGNGDGGQRILCKPIKPRQPSGDKLTAEVTP